nr:MAG TPA: hypothetical protein [Caudoviricetes sp.]
MLPHIEIYQLNISFLSFSGLFSYKAILTTSL